MFYLSPSVHPDCLLILGSYYGGFRGVRIEAVQRLSMQTWEKSISFVVAAFSTFVFLFFFFLGFLWGFSAWVLSMWELGGKRGLHFLLSLFFLGCRIFLCNGGLLV
jgi:hypothetical protein